MPKKKPNENRDSHLWTFEMVHGIKHSDFYVTTPGRDDVELAAAKAEAIRTDEDRFIPRECAILKLHYLGRLESD